MIDAERGNMVGPPHHAEIVRGVTAEQIRRSLAVMPRINRLVILLGYADGLTDAECALALDMTRQQCIELRVQAINLLCLDGRGKGEGEQPCP